MHTLALSASNLATSRTHEERASAATLNTSSINRDRVNYASTTLPRRATSALLQVSIAAIMQCLVEVPTTNVLALVYPPQNIVLDRLGGLNPARASSSAYFSEAHRIVVVIGGRVIRCCVSGQLLILASAASMSPDSHLLRVWIRVPPRDDWWRVDMDSFNLNGPERIRQQRHSLVKHK
ncbi:hypothetical protein B0H13DRAFT_2669108 [Mycena leptocephala]|nr:hypothetical protein B0H13DRAFT_2669108 [Mycena leptocephala]